MKLVRVCAFALILGCGGSSGGGDDDGPGPTPGDADGDTISDDHEGGGSVDTDGDGTPDFQDEDSDGDGIPDYREAGDGDVVTAPLDTDLDGTPDFQDLDSDANGRTDDLDGLDDLDGDSVSNFQDMDDDGDSIVDVDEIGPNALQPIDSDGDGTADYRDTDSDNDTIDDLYESAQDFDMDGTANYLDLDSDEDCIPDQVEAKGNPPADTDGDNRYDFVDRDSDDDGVADAQEDANCNGVTDAGESSATDDDTDNDGVSDMIEVAAGTDPTDAADNPQANGDFVFVEPYMKPQSPLDDDLDFSTKLQDIDVYVLIDRSGSMSTETTSIKTNLNTVINNLQCPPYGTGNMATCIPNLYAGLGGVGYQTNQPFTNYLDIQVDPNFASVSVTNVSGSPSTETLTFGTWAAITGQGSATSGGCSISAVPARTNCGAGRFGWPCFRSNALSVIALVTDEAPLSNTADTYECPAWSTVRSAMTARSAKLLGIYGSGSSTATLNDLRSMATDTGAVDAANGNAPLVFNGADANAASAIEDGIRTLANSVPLDINAVGVDDTTDSVDAMAAFVDRLETLQLGTAQCANGLNDVDTNGDTFKDKYLQVRTGTPVCWKVVSKPNTTVPATDVPQLFRAKVKVYGDGVTQLDERDVFFLVPPQPLDGPIF